MIPRLKPYLDSKEFSALFRSSRNAVEKFEEKFQQVFSVKHALAFPYGRSALWAFFKAMGIENAEIVQPAYTCSVVAHATVLSGNRPVFVDNNLTDYNMDYEQFARAITERTHAVIPTHLFGYCMDNPRVNEIVRKAEKRYGQHIYIIEDCAHSFDVARRGQPAIKAGDGALFGLGISKQITSIFGGMFTSDDDEIAECLKNWRDRNFKPSDWVKALRRALYLLAIYPAFNEAFYGLVYWLQEKTAILNRLTKAYHLDEAIHFPPDFFQQMCGTEANVGLVQLSKYAEVKKRRIEIADHYFSHISAPDTWVMPPQSENATYSHFVIRVPDRAEVMSFFAKRGIQLGQLIEYSIPHIPVYREYTGEQDFPNSLLCSQHTINLPIHPGLSQGQIDKIVTTVEEYKAQL